MRWTWLVAGAALVTVAWLLLWLLSVPVGCDHPGEFWTTREPLYVVFATLTIGAVAGALVGKRKSEDLGAGVPLAVVLAAALIGVLVSRSVRALEVQCKERERIVVTPPQPAPVEAPRKPLEMLADAIAAALPAHDAGSSDAGVKAREGKDKILSGLGGLRTALVPDAGAFSFEKPDGGDYEGTHSVDGGPRPVDFGTTETSTSSGGGAGLPPEVGLALFMACIAASEGNPLLCAALGQLLGISMGESGTEWQQIADGVMNAQGGPGPAAKQALTEALDRLKGQCQQPGVDRAACEASVQAFGSGLGNEELWRTLRPKLEAELKKVEGRVKDKLETACKNPNEQIAGIDPSYKPTICCVSRFTVDPSLDACARVKDPAFLDACAGIAGVQTEDPRLRATVAVLLCGSKK